MGSRTRTTGGARRGYSMAMTSAVNIAGLLMNLVGVAGDRGADRCCYIFNATINAIAQGKRHPRQEYSWRHRSFGYRSAALPNRSSKARRETKICTRTRLRLAMRSAQGMARVHIREIKMSSPNRWMRSAIGNRSSSAIASKP